MRVKLIFNKVFELDELDECPNLLLVSDSDVVVKFPDVMFDLMIKNKKNTLRVRD